jgi:hypothetical protein
LVLVIKSRLLDVRHKQNKETGRHPSGSSSATAIASATNATGASTAILATYIRVGDCRKRLCAAFVVVQGQGELLQMIDALAPPGGFSGGLHRGQQQRDQNPDNRDHDQQFHQGKTSFPAERLHEFSVTKSKKGRDLH